MVLMKKLTIVAKKDGGRGRKGRKILEKREEIFGKRATLMGCQEGKTGEMKIGVLRIVFMLPWCIFNFDKPWIFTLVMMMMMMMMKMMMMKVTNMTRSQGIAWKWRRESISLRGLPPPPLLLIYLDKHSLGNGRR